MQRKEILEEHKKLLLIYGSPTPPGRIASTLDFIKKEVDERQPSNIVEILTPSIYKSSSLLYWDEAAKKKVEEADAIIVASPVFRASLPAILKQLLDELPVSALRSKPVSLIAVGNIAEHYLGVERHFTDILSWFGSLYVPATCYITAPSLNNGISEETKGELNHLLDSTIYIANQLNGKRLDPMPIAEKYGR